VGLESFTEWSIGEQGEPSPSSFVQLVCKTRHVVLASHSTQKRFPLADLRYSLESRKFALIICTHLHALAMRLRDDPHSGAPVSAGMSSKAWASSAMCCSAAFLTVHTLIREGLTCSGTHVLKGLHEFRHALRHTLVLDFLSF